MVESAKNPDSSSAKNSQVFSAEVSTSVSSMVLSGTSRNVIGHEHTVQFNDNFVPSHKSHHYGNI